MASVIKVSEILHPTANVPSLTINSDSTVSFDAGILNVTGPINGVIGANTPYSGTFTNLSYSGTLTGNTGIINIGSGQVYKDVNGQIGIGTSSPGYRLDVAAGDTTANFGYALRLRSNATANAATLQFTNSGVSAENGYIRVTDAGLMSLSNKVYIDSSGNVGIGISSPDQPLAFADSLGTKIQFNGSNANGYQMGIASAVNSGDAMLKFTAGETGSGEFGFYNTTNLRMLINASGNVGIGTSSPATTLQVTGDITQTWAASMDRFVGSKFSTSYELGLHFIESSRETRIVSKAADSTGLISFYTGVTPTEKMRISAAGNVGIGNTNPSQKLVVEAGTGETCFDLNSTSSTGKSYTIVSGGSGGAFAGGRFGVYSRTDSTELLTLTSNTGSTAGGTTGKSVGFAYAGMWIDRGWADYPSITVTSTNSALNTNQAQLRLHGTNATWASYPAASGSDFSCSMYIDGTYQTSSDKRFKTNIETIDNALSKVMLITGKRFQTLTKAGEIETGFTENNFRYGFIAQELQSAGLDELYKHNVTEDDYTDGYNKAYAVEYTAVIPLLVNAIKELKSIIDQQDARIKTLEGNV